jgi:tetratricopeptide (TPR) repeat protein
MTKPYQTVGALLSALLFLAPCQSRRTAEEFARAKTALLEVSMKADSTGMVQARQRFENLLQDKHVAHDDSLAAWAHYFIAFANWQLAFATFNNQEGAKKVIADALAHLARASEKRVDLIEAYAVARRCLYWRYVLDQSTGKTVWSDSKAALEKARSLAPKHPLVVLEEAIDWFYKPVQLGGSQEHGLALFQESIKHIEQWSQNDVAYAKWWKATALMMLGQAYLSTENAVAAEETFWAALAVQPDFEYVKSAMMPMTQKVTPPPMRNLNNVAWTPLAADAERDGRNPGWADVKALSVHYDSPTDTLWVKLDLSSLPNPNAFGINLVVDTDQNQQTGAHWWGSNRAFTYDKLVTVWVIKDEGEAFRGTAGIADVRGVQLGRYSNLFRNNLAFRVDAQSKTMILGFKHKDLDDDDEMSLVAAAGAHVGWNDDIPDSGSVSIQLPRP